MRDDELEGLFRQARAERPLPEAMMARIVADAERLVPWPVRGVVRESLWEQVLAMVGGWGAMSGLAAAAVTGVWLGVLGGADMAGYVGLGGETLGAVELLPQAEVFAFATEIGE